MIAVGPLLASEHPDMFKVIGFVQAPFPLTLTLSPRERGPRSQSGGMPERVSAGAMASGKHTNPKGSCDRWGEEREVLRGQWVANCGGPVWWRQCQQARQRERVGGRNPTERSDRLYFRDEVLRFGEHPEWTVIHWPGRQPCRDEIRWPNGEG